MNALILSRCFTFSFLRSQVFARISFIFNKDKLKIHMRRMEMKTKQGKCRNQSPCYKENLRQLLCQFLFPSQDFLLTSKTVIVIRDQFSTTAHEINFEFFLNYFLYL